MAVKKTKQVKTTQTVVELPEIKVPQIMSPLQGFVDFIREQGVIGLAVGLALGTQVKTLVDQIIISFVNPSVGLLLPGKGTLAEKVFHMSFRDKGADFAWGAFASQLLSFVVVAAIIYFVVKGLKLDKLDKKKEA